jgi:quercetin dioxygenase-like cupin family protein
MAAGRLLALAWNSTSNANDSSGSQCRSGAREDPVDRNSLPHTVGPVYNVAHPGSQTETPDGGNEMKKSQAVPAIVIFTMVAAFVGFAQQKDKQVSYVSSAEATYKPSKMGGVSMHVLVGDPDKGRHATFTKFDPGYDAGMHTHTNDVSLVVIKGAYLYKDEAGEKRVGPGEFLLVPGGHKHWSGGDKTEGALFYQEGSGKFDLVPAK